MIWSQRSILFIELLIVLNLILANCSHHRRRHRHRHGQKIPISNHLHKSFANQWKIWEEKARLKRTDGYYPDDRQPEVGPWSEWTPLTSCSRTCGGGVFEETRTCLVEGSCYGNDRKYSSCNVEPCSSSLMDFREEQCARYNSVPFEGQYYSWVPYTKGPRRCELNCQPVGERFYYKHASKVIDGTKCDSSSNDVCVDGVCVPVGCDLSIDSNTKEDKCRVCGGDGSTCSTVSGSIDEKIFTMGYVDVILIPKGATNIFVEEVRSSNNYLAIRSQKPDHYYLNGDWKIDYPNPKNFANTTFHYERKKGGVSILAPEVVRALGPTNESLFLVLLYQEENPGIRYEFSIPIEFKSTKNVLYEWKINDWSQCSVTCGGGKMSRNVSCVQSTDFSPADSALCDPRLKPERNRTCNNHACQSSWETGKWTKCTTDCGTPGVQFRHVYCGQRVSEGRSAITNDSVCEELYGAVPESLRVCNDGVECPQWHVAHWSACDKLCGKGKQHRKVLCYKVENGTTQVLPSEECSGTRPAVEMDCIGPPCKGTDWIVSDWTECGIECGPATKTRQVFCFSKEGTILEDESCDSIRKPSISQQCKETVSCQYRWYTSEWSQCSELCGIGLKTRHVFCGSSSANSSLENTVDEKGDHEDSVSIVENENCPAERPISSESCVDHSKCEKIWFSSEFGKCSASCGGGDKNRLVFCFENQTNVAYTDCDKDTKPFEKENCNMEQCTDEDVVTTTENPLYKDLQWCDDDDIEIQPMAEAEIHVTESQPMAEVGKKLEKTRIEDGIENTTTATEISDIDTFNTTVLPENTTESHYTENSNHTEISRKKRDVEAVESIYDDFTTVSSYEVSGEGTKMTDGEATDRAGEEVTEETFEGKNATENITVEENITEKLLGEVEVIKEVTEKAFDGVGEGTDIGMEEGNAIEESFEKVNYDESSRPRVIAEANLDELIEEAEKIRQLKETEAEFTATESIFNFITTVFNSIGGNTAQNEVNTTKSENNLAENGEKIEENEEKNIPETLVTDNTKSLDETTVFLLIDSSTAKTVESIEVSATETATPAETLKGATKTAESIGETVTPTTKRLESADELVETTSERLVSAGETVKPTNEMLEFDDQTTDGKGSETEQGKSRKEVTENNLVSTTLNPSEIDSLAEKDANLAKNETFEKDALEGDDAFEVLNVSTTVETVIDETTETVSVTDEILVSVDETTETIGKMTEPTVKGTEVAGDTTETSHIVTENSEKTTETAEKITETAEKITETADVTTETNDKAVETADVTTEIAEKSADTTDKLAEIPEETTETVRKTTETAEETTGTVDITTETADATAKTAEKTTISSIEVRIAPEIKEKTAESKKEAVEEAEISVEPAEITCKPRPSLKCSESKYGCCGDGTTAAEGPFQKGCTLVETCDDTEFGCCPDEVTPAEGTKYLGCLKTSICESSLFGCCSDNYTEAQGPEEEGCEKLIEFHCQDSSYGCCPDGEIPSMGPDLEGCVLIDCDVLTGLCTPCTENEWGCCPDTETPASGPDFDGCFDEIEGSATEPSTTISSDILPDCARSPFGCCPDNFTSAHGEDLEGCCLASPFGCCPDHISVAKGPGFEGCGCEFTVFGCCPDNETVARGPENAGCGCQFTTFGCCPDDYTPAVGVNYTGCPCSTFEFGCCPDGISIAKGDNDEGCGCDHTEFGCCPDLRTPAAGPQFEGCGCEASMYGCCADGVTAAEGKFFEGCDAAPVIPGEVCGFAKDRGPCRNFTVKYYFDLTHGGCTRFWYGGCEGNLNRFETEQECKSTCVEPTGQELCHLPPVKGPCSSYEPSWYHDPETQSCQPFEYRGCYGNNNRFPSREKCEEVCVIPQKIDVCLMPKTEGPCNGNFTRWYYDETEEICTQFTFGGCKGNANNFLNENECLHRCIRGRSHDICGLPKSSGLCEETLPRWYYDYSEQRCMPFYYTGCDGNANRFLTRMECEGTCSHEQFIEDTSTCTLKKEVGNCTDYVERFYYNIVSGNCELFLYGGCHGNENNFEKMEICRSKCEDKEFEFESEDFSVEFCFLPADQGTCEDFSALWYYDSVDGACKQFLYGGCDGNGNKFKTRQQCENKCGESQDICRLPVVVGPCSGTFNQYFYDYSRDECLPFEYSGCDGNKNRFDSKYLCEQRCQQRPLSVSTTTSRIYTEYPSYPETAVSELPSICKLPKVVGLCKAAFLSWYFDAEQERCVGFTYGGCQGNANRFKSVEHCERQCGKFRDKDVCSEPVNPGNCEGTLTKWYHEPYERKCIPFYYTGCAGNANRFSSGPECEAECVYHDTILPVSDNAIDTVIQICELPRSSGSCLDGFKRWYFNPASATCESFLYGGCGGNQNRFKNFNQCMQYCGEVASRYGAKEPTTVFQPTQRPTEPPRRIDPCLSEKTECQALQCPYGITRRVESNNCERCACLNPCENVICSDEHRCVIDMADDGQYEPFCRQEMKADECPAPSDELTRCDDECNSDALCDASKKCCYNGCAYVCLTPRKEQRVSMETPARITYYDTNMESEENDVVTLSCKAEGTPEPAIEWFRNGAKVPVSRDSRIQMLYDYSLRIINTKRSDAGVYVCVANNGIGRPDQKDVRLDIIDPSPRPAKIVPPQDSSPVVALGTPVVLRCWSVGWPRPVFSWWRGTTMMPRTSEKYDSLPLGGLRINYIGLRDLGPYTCQAYNGEGRAATYTFVVRGLGPIAIISPADRSYAQYVVTPPKISTVKPTTSTTRRPPPVTIHLPKSTTKPEYWPPPPEARLKALIRTNTTKFAPFANIVLRCDVQGSGPSPTVEWFHDDEKILPTSRINIESDHTLVISNAEERDKGTYKCVASNLHGEVSSTVDISIEGVYIHSRCTDNQYFADCKLIVAGRYCTNKHYARYCCKSCTLAGQLPSYGAHLRN